MPVIWLLHGSSVFWLVHWQISFKKGGGSNGKITRRQCEKFCAIFWRTYSRNVNAYQVKHIKELLIENDGTHVSLWYEYIRRSSQHTKCLKIYLLGQKNSEAERLLPAPVGRIAKKIDVMVCQAKVRNGKERQNRNHQHCGGILSVLA